VARILIQAVHSDGQARRWTLSERIVAENFNSDHFVTQLIERLSWATADAEALESHSADLVPDDGGGNKRSRRATASEQPSPPGRSGAQGAAPVTLVRA
jgi:hypothetical protein